MPTALNMLRTDLVYRRSVFDKGLESAGYTLAKSKDFTPKPGDLLLIWNRYGVNDALARRFEAMGAAVAVAENGYLGKHWQGREWFAISYSHHNGAGIWPAGWADKGVELGKDRWSQWGEELRPWRLDGKEVILLPQRGIGEPGVRMEPHWLGETRLRFPSARVRMHPGLDKSVVPLEDDLRDARFVVTWASGAAIRALLWGIPVLYGMRHWIGAPSATLLTEECLSPSRPDNRLSTFRRLMWAQWNMAEVEAGVPFTCLREYFSSVAGRQVHGVSVPSNSAPPSGVPSTPLRTLTR